MEIPVSGSGVDRWSRPEVRDRFAVGREADSVPPQGGYRDREGVDVVGAP